MAARCVRVIHAQCVLQFALLSRTLLRSSSNNEPSDPPYRIIIVCLYVYIYVRFIFNDKQQWFVEWKGLKQDHNNRKANFRCYDLLCDIMVRHNHHIHEIVRSVCWWLNWIKSIKNGNDPYAGSPTNTLLRLLLPLNDPVWASFRYKPNDPKAARKTKPKISLKHSIGSSDGRCVQRTGT